MVEETTRIIKERDEFWAAEIEKIRSELRMAKDMPQKGSPYNSSHQGSCSDLNGEPRFGKEDPVKKKLNVESEADAGEGGEEKVADSIFSKLVSTFFKYSFSAFCALAVIISANKRIVSSSFIFIMNKCLLVHCSDLMPFKSTNNS